jgi:hypothetical protein
MKAVIITLIIMTLTFKSPNLPAGSRKGLTLNKKIKKRFKNFFLSPY